MRLPLVTAPTAPDGPDRQSLNLITLMTHGRDLQRAERQDLEVHEAKPVSVGDVVVYEYDSVASVGDVASGKWPLPLGVAKVLKVLSSSPLDASAEFEVHDYHAHSWVGTFTLALPKASYTQTITRDTFHIAGSGVLGGRGGVFTKAKKLTAATKKRLATIPAAKFDPHPKKTAAKKRARKQQPSSSEQSSSDSSG